MPENRLMGLQRFQAIVLQRLRGDDAVGIPRVDDPATAVCLNDPSLSVPAILVALSIFILRRSIVLNSRPSAAGVPYSRFYLAPLLHRS